MSHIVIISVALAIFSAATGLILREIRRARTDKGGRPAGASENSLIAPPSLIPRPFASLIPPRTPEEEDLDITKVGSMYTQAAIPRLGELDNDADEVVSESSALTIFEDGADVEETTGPVDIILVSAAAHSDPGKKRRRNEDSYLLDDNRAVFVVADGMGGYSGGDVASRLATEVIASHFKQETSKSEGPTGRPKEGNHLVAAIENANTAIYTRAADDPALHGMGATIVAASFVVRKRRAYIAYAGDSRCYRLRDGQLRLFTNDHVLAAKGVTGPMANRVRRGLGIRPTIKVDLIVDLPKPGDIYLLCSDGLNKMIDDSELSKVISKHHDDLPICAQTLVARANEAGGKDNVTAVVIGVHEANLSRSSAQTSGAGM